MKWLTEINTSEIKKVVIKEGWYVEDLLRITHQAFRDRDIELAQKVEQDYWKVYNEYLSIVNNSQIIIAMCAPTGYSLRFVFGSTLISKILLDISTRLKDIASDITELVKEPDVSKSIMLPDMFLFAQKMLRKALRVYVDQNIEGASGICTQDSVMDQMFLNFNEEIIRLIQDNPRVIRRGLLLMDISKALEEISDFSVQIIEITHYILTGKYYTCYNDNLQLFSFELFTNLNN
ncbi:MAG: phosphate signaling complex PhoU family protein, partial [Fervidobacterium pennivorans]